MRILLIVLVALYLSGLIVFSQSSSSVGFDLPPYASSSWNTVETLGLNTGYARVQANAGSVLPSGMAIFSFRSGGVLVSEASVPIMPLISSGRMYAEITPSSRTGIAIANPNARTVSLDFYFTDANGVNIGKGNFTLGANRQIAGFVNEAPFNGPTDLQGSLTFTTSDLVSAVALRGVFNERGEFFMTTLPISDLIGVGGSSAVIPQFADGGGWSTEIILVNSQSTNLTGSLDWFDQNGQRVSFSGGYSVPARSSKRYFTTGSGSSIQVGSIVITPDRLSGLRGSQVQPSAAAIYTFRSRGVTVTQAAVPSMFPDRAFRVFVDNFGNSRRTGIAVRNNSSTSAIVNLELFRSDGAPTGLTGTLSLPASCQTAVFLDEIPGFASMPSEFQGVLRVTAVDPFVGLAVVGLRGRYNERGDFLVTTAVAANENPGAYENQATAASSELMFPHFAVGGGYETQFVLFSPRLQDTSGRMYFFNRDGSPTVIPLRN